MIPNSLLNYAKTQESIGEICLTRKTIEEEEKQTIKQEEKFTSSQMSISYIKLIKKSFQKTTSEKKNLFSTLALIFNKLECNIEHTLNKHQMS